MLEEEERSDLFLSLSLPRCHVVSVVYESFSFLRSWFFSSSSLSLSFFSRYVHLIDGMYIERRRATSRRVLMFDK